MSCLTRSDKFWLHETRASTTDQKRGPTGPFFFRRIYTSYNERLKGCVMKIKVIVLGVFVTVVLALWLIKKRIQDGKI
jgi:hypothetical protein